MKTASYVLAYVFLSIALVSAQIPDAVDTPDAPSATASTTCTEKNGRPCPEWLHKLIGQYPPKPGEDKLELKQLTWKQTFKSKTFWAVEAIEAAAIIGDERDTFIGVSHGCFEKGFYGGYHPSFGRIGTVDWTFQFLPTTLIGLTLRKLGVPFAPYTGQLAVAAKHSQGIAAWHQTGCL